jgi:[protein-PII] uridylyltransferase
MTLANPKSTDVPVANRFDDLVKNRITGRAFAAAHSDQMDETLIALCAEYLTSAPGLCLVALGGYGRGELCPYSDIDIMFLSETGNNPAEGETIEKILYALWDKGLKVGHSVRTIDDCLTLAQKDQKVLTSLLDSRMVCGHAQIYQTLQSAMSGLFTAAGKHDFFKNKLAERDARHARYGDTRYVLEPNIKEGKGALRDYQTLFWLTEVLYGAKTLGDLVDKNILTPAEARRFKKAHDFLLTVRCHLHELAGRAEERLHFDIQPDLAERLGYKGRHSGRAVERFMKHYFLITRDIGDMTRILIAAMQADEGTESHDETHDGFNIEQDRLSFSDLRDPKTDPVNMLRLFRAAQETGRGIHPQALKLITRNIRQIDDDVREDPAANQLFLDILTDRKDAAHTLRRMNEAGVLGKFIPDFGRIIALMQFDRYHYYTVDEHTLHCIDILHQLEQGLLKEDAPIASYIAQNLTDRTPLFVAMFLHDICKGRGGRHSELGAELALSLCPRFGLNGVETDLVSWLVHEHLLMSDTAFKRNMNDPKTIADFSAKIRTPERLDLLFMLTTADIMGVGPGRWTAWKARLLEELYLKTRALMDGEEPGITAEIEIPDDLQDGETRVTITTDEAQSSTIVIVYTPDRPGLFATLCGALSAEGANIMRAYINTLPGRLAVDRFVIQNATGLPFRQERRQEDLRQSIIDALDGKLDIEAQIAAHVTPPTKNDLVFDLPPKIWLHNDASGSDTVVEVETRDRHGLLYDIACTFRDLGLDLRAAKINTQGLRAIDAFYVQTSKRKKLVDLAGQDRLIDALKAKVAKV